MAEAENALEVRLAELEAFGLGRPLNVLFTEYVSVLVDRGVIDAAMAEQLSLAFHAAHYGALDTEEPGFLATMARLQDVTDRLAAMPAERRRELAEQVQGDFRAITESASRSQRDNGSRTADQDRGALFEVANTFAGPEPWEVSYPEQEMAAPRADRGRSTPSVTRRVVQLIVMIPAAAGLVFAGYASHNRIVQILESRGYAVEPRHRHREGPPIRRPDPRAEQEQFENSLLSSAAQEAANRHDQKAKFAYELLLQYRPDDATALNNLAWLYLTTSDAAVHNPERGLELGLQAIKLQRSAGFLDTVAEGYFQTGDPAEAVKLEREALSRERASSWLRAGNQSAVMQQQLDKFRKALASKNKSDIPPSPSTVKPPRTVPSATASSRAGAAGPSAATVAPPGKTGSPAPQSPGKGSAGSGAAPGVSARQSAVQ
jgi:hypothetical protein